MTITPDDNVIEQIIKKVKEKAIILEKDMNNFDKRLREGNLKEEDWRLFAEGKYIEKAGKDGKED